MACLIGAGYGNRTRLACLEGKSIATMLIPRCPAKLIAEGGDPAHDPAMKITASGPNHGYMNRSKRKFTILFDGFARSSINLCAVELARRYADDLGPVRFSLGRIDVRMGVYGPP